MTTDDKPSQISLNIAKAAMDSGRWEESLTHYGLITQSNPHYAPAWHNTGVCLYALNKPSYAIAACLRAYNLDPSLWQSHLVVGKAYQQLGKIQEAEAFFSKVLLQHDPNNAEALIARADIAINHFGCVMDAIQMVKHLLNHPVYKEDAQLTTLMAKLYDRDESAEELNKQIIAFSQNHLRIDRKTIKAFVPKRTKKRASVPRVGIISPLFCASPVYFLTIDHWHRHYPMADFIFFNRGFKQDWATDEFKELATEWYDVPSHTAHQLATALIEADLDVLYDLGGWMDAVALKALSTKPAAKMFKWVGGQSVTTGLDCFDGWIGDDAQSPMSCSHLYTEPLINIPSGYATYTPPPYMPTPPATKREGVAIFANPAKVSRVFLNAMRFTKGTKVFIHQQYRHLQARTRIQDALGKDNVEFITPKSHQEALEALSSFKVMVDTFPYSSGLTAREAQALGVEVKTLKVGTLFCERHTAPLPVGEKAEPNA